MRLRRQAFIKHALLVVAVCLQGASTAAGELLLAEGGKARLPILLPRDASEVERSAAEELARYLNRTAGARFKIKRERPRGKKARPGIYLGRTEFARHLGLDGSRPESEAWHVVTHGDKLLLAGDGPRGTLYAVYRFLEDQVGVRWWTPWEEQVPSLELLSVSRGDRHGEPAFVYRDLCGIRGPSLFCAHNRINGHFSFLPQRYGGREEYGPPDQVHNLFRYLPPDEFFAGHPEFYAELSGRRTAERAQLCFSNLEVAKRIEERMRGWIEQARAAAVQEGERPPRLFAVSQNDYNGACECGVCDRLVREHGNAQSAALVTLINRVARGIARDHPEVLVDTLAYGHTFVPPQGLRYEDNVSLRVAALYDRDFAKPITASVHRFYREALAGWREKTAHLRVWDYAVTYGDEANLPLPNLPVLATDLRYYRKHGVEGLFLQFDRPILSDMRDLKLWVTIKLVEDPDRDLPRLVREFTDGYYGPAGAVIRGYLWLLDEAAAKDPPSIGYPPKLGDYGFLDREFLLEAHARFDQAENLVADDPTLLFRVRRARFSLDRGTVLLWESRFGPRSRATQPDGGELRVREVATRARWTAHRTIEQRIPAGRREREQRKIDRELAPIVARYEELKESPPSR